MKLNQKLIPWDKVEEMETIANDRTALSQIDSQIPQVRLRALVQIWDLVLEYEDLRASFINILNSSIKLQNHLKIDKIINQFKGSTI